MVPGDGNTKPASVYRYGRIDRVSSTFRNFSVQVSRSVTIEVKNTPSSILLEKEKGRDRSLILAE